MRLDQTSVSVAIRREVVVVMSRESDKGNAQQRQHKLKEIGSNFFQLLSPSVNEEIFGNDSRVRAYKRFYKVLVIGAQLSVILGPVSIPDSRR